MLCKKVVPIRPDMPRFHIHVERAVYPRKCRRCGIVAVLAVSGVCWMAVAYMLWSLMK